MVWTVIANGDVDADSPITTSLMTALRDNVTALANGDAGAPLIQNAAMAVDSVDQANLTTDSVGQDEIKTESQLIEGTAGTQFYFTATGGIYVIGHTIDRAAAAGNRFDRRADSGSDSFISRWAMTLVASPGNENDGRLYYINASPPYDLGDGDIPLFAFAVVDNATGDIVGQSMSIDPPWVYNGPTDCRVAKTIAGKKHRIRRDMSAHPETLAQSINKGPAAVKAYAQAFSQAPIVYEEITDSLKHQDMNIVPNPFHGAELPGKTVVMLDPMSDAIRDLSIMRQHDEVKPTKIIRNYMKIGNSPLNRVGPAGLMIVSADWRGP